MEKPEIVIDNNNRVTYFPHRIPCYAVKNNVDEVHVHFSVLLFLLEMTDEKGQR